MLCAYCGWALVLGSVIGSAVCAVLSWHERRPLGPREYLYSASLDIRGQPVLVRATATPISTSAFFAAQFAVFYCVALPLFGEVYAPLFLAEGPLPGHSYSKEYEIASRFFEHCLERLSLFAGSPAQDTPPFKQDLHSVKAQFAARVGDLKVYAAEACTRTRQRRIAGDL
jgi:hypothetical protein